VEKVEESVGCRMGLICPAHGLFRPNSAYFSPFSGLKKDLESAQIKGF
jgi:hypothetical protein